MQRYQELVKIPETELSEMNRKEIDVIRYWFDIKPKAHVETSNNRARLHELIDHLADSDCTLAELLLERLTK